MVSEIWSLFICRVYEPELVHERKAGRLKRRRFWAAGVNDIVAIDQHDKWKRFGLALHIGVDPFAGRIHWVESLVDKQQPKAHFVILFRVWLKHSSVRQASIH